MNEIVFAPYDACDLKRILDIRVRKALNMKMIETGVVEKIAAYASRQHGDARKAVRPCNPRRIDVGRNWAWSAIATVI